MSSALLTLSAGVCVLESRSSGLPHSVMTTKILRSLLAFYSMKQEEQKSEEKSLYADHNDMDCTRDLPHSEKCKIRKINKYL
jgi:hypothetical protein